MRLTAASSLLFATDPGLSSQEPGMPIVNLGFCGADDHLLVGIGDHRQGVFRGYFPLQGIFARIELYATDGEVLSLVDAAIAGATHGEGVCLDVVEMGQYGRDIATQLRRSATYADSIRTQLLQLLHQFRSNPYVLEQARQYKLERAGTDDISEVVIPLGVLDDNETDDRDTGLEDEMEEGYGTVLAVYYYFR